MFLRSTTTRAARITTKWRRVGESSLLRIFLDDIAPRDIQWDVIKTFRNDETERLYFTGKSRKFQAVERVAVRKLRMLSRSTKLLDLGVIPGNMPEALKGDRAGQHSIRVNDQYRICFEWTDGDSYNVEITDYH